jgi:Ni/Fe-hydrogenase subunit HybB-like protein
MKSVRQGRELIMANNNHAAPAPAPVGGSLVNAVTLTCFVLIALMAAILMVRFLFGLGAVTGINDGYPWGIWVVVDVVIGSAFACGGFSVAMLVYIFNKGEYHPLVRPALLASLFGYTLAAAGVIFDLGRWWNVWNMFWPGSINPNSVMFEVAVCITLYVIVMWIEFSPTFLEQMGKDEARRKVGRVMFFVIALGTVLPMMHQSSLGTLLVVMGVQIHPLWQTPVLPLLYLLTAVTMGYAVVLFESCLTSSAYRRKLETHMLTPLAKVMLGFLAVFLVVRVGDLVVRGALGKAFVPSVEALMFWLEMACFIAPLVLIGAESNRRNPARLFLAGVLLMLGGSLMRLNGYLIGYETGDGFSYFPTLAEVLVTAGMFAVEVLGYIIITRRFPVSAPGKTCRRLTKNSWMETEKCPSA